MNYSKIPNRILEENPNIVPGGIYDNPLSDEGFKKLLASRTSLTDFLNAVMHLEKEHEIKYLKFKTKRISYHVFDSEGDEKKTWCFDIRAQTRDGRAIDIEVQNLHHDFFCDRVLTYGAALMLKAKAELDKERTDKDKRKLAQRTPPELTKEERRERRNQFYELPETVGIWVCNFAIPKDSQEPWDNWMLYSEKAIHKGNPLPVTNKIKYIFVQLPNFRKSSSELKTIEDEWLYVLKHAFSSTTEIDIQNDAVTEALDRIRFTENEDTPMITKEERECTIASIEIAAEQRGIEIGEQRGIEIGEQRGIEIGEQRGIEIGEQRGIEIGEQRGIEIGEQRGIEIGEQRARQQANAMIQKLEEQIRQLQAKLANK